MSPWVRRLALAAVATAVVLVATAVLDFEPEPVPVALLTLLALAVTWALAAALSLEQVSWSVPTVRPPPGRGRDAVTQAHLRHLEDHGATRHPDAVVRDTLARLADRMLRTRHGVQVDSARGRELLGPEVCDLLDAADVRLSPRRIDHCLRTIEEL